MRSAYAFFDFFHEAVNSHNLETANHIAYVIFRASYRYENTLVDPSKHTYYLNDFINIHFKIIICGS